MFAKARNPRGFTLVELLVVITIIGILVAMLMPAIQAARESGRRAQCKNKLHQIGVACLSFEAKVGYYPPSGWGVLWTGDPDQGVGARQPGGWIYQILPELGADTVHKLGAEMPEAAKKAALKEQLEAVNPLFQCPSRRRAIGYPANVIPVNALEPQLVAKTDYAANGGPHVIVSDKGPTNLDCPATYPDCDWSNDDKFLEDEFFGISGERSQVKEAQVRDGAASTLLAAEKYLSPACYLSGDAYGDNNSMYQGNDWDTNRWTPTAGGDGQAARRPLQDTLELGPNENERFGSAHSAGFHYVMCDGRADLARYSIDAKVFGRMGDRRDGQLIDTWEW